MVRNIRVIHPGYLYISSHDLKLPRKSTRENVIAAIRKSYGKYTIERLTMHEY